MAENGRFFAGRKRKGGITRSPFYFIITIAKIKQKIALPFRGLLEAESLQKGRKNPHKILDAHFHLLHQADLFPPGRFEFSSGLSRFFSEVPSSTDLIPPLKFLMARPKPDPISGNRLAPKMRKMIARMITSSCVPSPNNLLTPLRFLHGAVYSRLRF